MEVAQRLEELRTERALGLRRLEELASEYDRTREVLLRITGAIQVLEELSAAGSDDAPGRPVAVAG